MEMRDAPHFAGSNMPRRVPNWRSICVVGEWISEPLNKAPHLVLSQRMVSNGDPRVSATAAEGGFCFSFAFGSMGAQRFRHVPIFTYRVRVLRAPPLGF